MDLEKGKPSISPADSFPRSPAIRQTHARVGPAKGSGGGAEGFFICLSYLMLIVFFPLSILCVFMVVQEYQRAVMFRLGRLKEGPAKGPGVIFYLPCIDSSRIVDLRTVSFDVPPQEVLTKDSVTVQVDAVVYYRVREPVDAIVKIENYSASTKLLAQTTLRNELGKRDLAHLLSDREAISHTMQVTLDEATDPWGIEVERVEIKDVRLPYQLQKAMAAEAEAKREARAKIIVAEGEIKASKALGEASKVMADNPVALQLRYLQTLSNISSTSENSSTVIFPFPMEFLKSFLGRSSGINTRVKVTTRYEVRISNFVVEPLTTLGTSNWREVVQKREEWRTLVSEAQG